MVKAVIGNRQIPMCGRTLLRVNDEEESDIVLSAAHCAETETGAVISID